MVCNFRDLAKFTIFFFTKCFPLKGTWLILNEIAKFSLENFFTIQYVFISNDCYSTMMSNDIT